MLLRFLEQHSDALDPLPSCDQAIEFPALAEYLRQYQSPLAAERFTQLKQGIADTTEVLYKTIDQVLERGQSIESIMEKSEDLSGASLQFYKTSKKTRCCTIL